MPGTPDTGESAAPATEPPPRFDVRIATETGRIAEGVGGFEISGDTLVSGSAILERNADGADQWGRVADLVGGGSDIDGDTVVTGTSESHRNGTVWIQERNAAGADAWGVVGDLHCCGIRFSRFPQLLVVRGDDLFATTSTDVLFYRRNAGAPGDWALAYWLEVPDTNRDIEVAIQGDTLVIGNHWALDFPPDGTVVRGAVFVYERDPAMSESGWRLVTTLRPRVSDGPDDLVYSGFGVRVDVDGDTLVVGAPGQDDAPFPKPTVYVYRRNVGGPDAWGEVARLMPRDGLVGDGFGAMVAAQGSRVAVGAQGHDAGSENTGAVYVFERNAGGADVWGQIAKLLPADVVAGAGFGYDVALLGEEIYAGSFSHQENVRIFEVAGCEWGTVGELRPPGGGTGDQAGFAVSLHGERVLLGVRGAAAAHLFERNAGGADEWGPVADLAGVDTLPGDGFGRSVSLGIGRAVVGAWSADDEIGAAHVFERNAGGPDQWQQVRRLVASDGVAGDRFGYGVGVDGATIVVGAPADANGGSGAAYVFEREMVDGTWRETMKLTPSDADAGDAFGTAVVVSGNTVLIGAPGDDDGGTDAGAVYVFERHRGGAEGWGEVRKQRGSNATAGDGFGGAVALAGALAVIGAPASFAESGAAYVLSRHAGGPDNWGEVAMLVPEDPFPGYHFGAGVGLHHDVAAVGAPRDADGLDLPGSVYLFRRNEGGADAWGQFEVLSVGGTKQNGFGGALDVGPYHVAVGAFLDDGVASDAGSGFVLATGGCSCGNGVLEDGEDCDDDNTVDGDGCSSGCSIEPCQDADDDGVGLLGRSTCPVPSARDNCADTYNPPQSDSDGVGDHCDLDDGLIYMTIATNGAADWQSETGFDSWNYYRGDLAALRAGGPYTQDPVGNPLARRLCGLLGSIVLDNVEFQPGDAVFFLVSGVAAGVEGGLGFDSDGASRPNDAPCP